MNKSGETQRIAILSPAHPLRGGIASSTERLAVELQAHGHEVIIYSFTLQYPGFLFPGKTQYTSDPPPPGLTIRPAINSVNPLSWWRLGRELARRRPDLILVRYWLPFMGPSLGAICRLARGNGHSRVIAIADNIIPHEPRPGDRLFTRFFVGGVDGFIVLSHAVGDDARRFAPGKPVVCVPHPIYDNYGPLVGRTAALAHLGLPADRRYLLFFGFIRAYKGLDILLRALAVERLRARQDLHLLVAGEFYDDPEPYRRLVAELGLQGRVHFFDDYIPNEEVKYYFGAADLVTQPYRAATQSGISQMAYHFETPMLVTRVGGLPEIVRHGREGYVVEVDETAIAAAIADFFDNDRADTMRGAVREAKARFSWSSLVAGIGDVYRQILNDKNPS